MRRASAEAGEMRNSAGGRSRYPQAPRHRTAANAVVFLELKAEAKEEAGATGIPGSVREGLVPKVRTVDLLIPGQLSTPREPVTAIKSPEPPSQGPRKASSLQGVSSPCYSHRISL